MKAFLIIILSFPLICFASFPIKSDFQKNDTIIINGKVFVETEVDSLSRYPIEKETLAQYKERLKKHMNINTNTSKPEASWKNFMDNNSNISSKSNTIDWVLVTFNVILTLVIGFLILILILYASSGPFGV